MKSLQKFVFFFLLFIFVSYSSASFAALKYWVGPADGSFADDANWSTSSGGANDTTAPGASDIVYFTSDDTDDCSIDSNITVDGIVMDTGYTGTVTQEAGVTISIGDGAFNGDAGNENFIVTAGTFQGGNSNITINNHLTIGNDGTFTSTSGTLSIILDFTNTGTGTFNHNNGTVRFYGNWGGSDADINVNSSETFYNLTAEKTSAKVDLQSGDTLIVVNNANLNDGNLGGSGTYQFQGDVTVDAGMDYISGRIEFTGSADQAWTLGCSSCVDHFVEIDKTSGTVTLSGDLNMDAHVNYDLIITSGTFDLGTNDFSCLGQLILDGGTFTNGGSNTISVADIDLNSGSFHGQDSALTITNDILIDSGTTFTASSGTTNLKRNFTNTGTGVFNHNNGTFRFYGSTSTYNVNSSDTFNDVVFDSNSGSALNLTSGDTLIANNVTFEDGSCSSNGKVQASGDVTISSDWGTMGCALEFTGSSSQNFTTNDYATFAGHITVNKSDGTVTQTGALTLNSVNFDFTMTSGAYVATDALTIEKTFIQTGGIFIADSDADFTTKIFTMSDGRFDAPANATLITSGGDFTFSGGTFNHNNGTLEMRGSGSDFNATEGFELYNFHVNPTSAWAVTMADSDTLVVLGGLYIMDGRLNGGAVEVRGDVTTHADTESGNTATLTFTGSANQRVSLASGKEDLWDGDWIINKSGGKVTLASNIDLNATNQDLIVREGGFDTGGFDVTVDGTSGQFDVEDGGVLYLDGDETITANSSNPDLQSGSTVVFEATSGTISVPNWSYHHLTFNGSGGAFNLGATESIAGNLTITAGTFDISGYDLTVTGTFSNEDTFRMQGGETITATLDTDSGTIEFDGSGSYTSLPTTTFNNVVFNGSGSWDADRNLDINGNFTVTSGTFDLNGKTMNVSGDLSNAGTFTHSNGTVVLDGSSQEIATAFTFYNLHKNVSSTDTLELGGNITIANNLILGGASSNLLSVQSDSSGSQRQVSVTTAAYLKYLNIKDINNVTGSDLGCNIGCTDGGNNSNFSFTNMLTNASTQTYEFTEDADNYTFSGTNIELNASSNSLIRLKDLGGSTYYTNAPSGMTKAKTISVQNNESSELTNYQVKVTVSYDSDMQEDFDDIRFYDSDRSTALDHWLESKTDGDSAVFWVEIPSLEASSTETIYMFYGNVSASSASNGANTFYDYDDFSSDPGVTDTGSRVYTLGISTPDDNKVAIDMDYTVDSYASNQFSVATNYKHGTVVNLMRSSSDTDDSAQLPAILVPGGGDAYQVTTGQQYDLTLLRLGDTVSVILDGTTVSTRTGMSTDTASDFRISLYNGGGAAGSVSYDATKKSRQQRKRRKPTEFQRPIWSLF